MTGMQTLDWVVRHWIIKRLSAGSVFGRTVTALTYPMKETKTDSNFNLVRYLSSDSRRIMCPEMIIAKSF